MKKVLFLILCFFASITVVNATSISSIDMDIILSNDGTAIVTETWKAKVTQGTEGWHPYYNLGNSKLRVLSASMDGMSYSVENSWDESASLKEKSYKAGIYKVNNNEYDVVFGVSSYGSHTYKIVYEITNFVSNLDDADMIYWQLFPYDFSSEPSNVTIKISGPYKYPDTLDVWGFGMYGAPCYVKDGAIYMTSDGKISSSEYLTLLAKFPKGTFNTTSKLDGTFDNYLTKGQDGSRTYSEPKTSTFEKIMLFLTTIGQFILWIFVALLINRSIQKNKINYDFGPEGKKLPKDVNNFRDIPCKKDIYRAFWVADTYELNKNKNDFFGVLLLKWIYNGNVKVEKRIEKKLFKNKEQDVIIFDHEPSEANVNEKNLYQYMKEASGDNILEKDEFKKWCKNHYDKILGWTDKVLDSERKELITAGAITDVKVQKGAIFHYDVHQYRINDVLRNDAIEMKGLKNFLNEFSQIDKKEPIEVKLWNEYLMYAQIFGIADKVMERFKNLYPEIIEDMNNYNLDFDTFVFVHDVSRSGVKAASDARSAAQSYSSGGGGFSSGGGGGGSFGGGGGGGGFR